MWIAIANTPGVENRDFSSLRYAASGGAGIPAFVGVLDKAVKVMLGKFKPEDIQPGDVFATNDPYYGGVTHLNDIVVAMPVFAEGRLIAWRPSEAGGTPPGHLWRWELEPVDDGHTLVTHTYDWTQLTDPKRMERARNTKAENLRASIDRLAAIAES